MSGPLLSLERVAVDLRVGSAIASAVDGVDFSVSPGESVGLVGESGCGKSLTALTIMRLLPGAVARVRGRVLFNGEDLLSAPEQRMRRLRGRHIGLLLQDPGGCLNPLLSVGAQLVEVLRLHRGVGGPEARREAIELLAALGIPGPEERLRAYAHELSGGMRQRVALALALGGGPELLLLDEPTTALDVTLQAQALALLRRVQRERGMALLLITHDLSLLAQGCDQVVVMYAGRVVERAPVRGFVSGPRHPYSAGLWSSAPDGRRASEGYRLAAIPGAVPALGQRGPGCRFRNRCARASGLCADADPELSPVGNGHAVACHHPLAGSDG